MKLVRGTASLPFGPQPTAVTIGFFDGVHLGHRDLLERTARAARERGLLPVAVTFDRHPREILTPERAPPLLTTFERKAELIAEARIEALVVLEFTHDFARWRPEEFVSGVLMRGLRTRHAVVGLNFTFGHRAQGNVGLLADLGVSHGFTVEAVELMTLDGRAVSSSSIREALMRGDLSWPERALGRRYAVEGRVVPGAGRGARLGFPTANLATDPRLLLPGAGIYAGVARHAAAERPAAISVGTNPTFGEEPLHVEVFLLDFEGDLRGEALTVEFWARLRDEVRFDSEDGLVRQMRDDAERTRSLVAALNRS